MKKFLFISFFLVLLACSKEIPVIETKTSTGNEDEKEAPGKINPPLITVDSSLVIIEDTLGISF